MWWQYGITFLVSLVIALISVWIAQWLSAKRERSKALGNLKSEISSNIKDCMLISEWLDKDFDALTRSETALTPYPRLHDSAWYQARGILISDYATTAELENAYRLISIINNMLGRIEELRYGHINQTSRGFTRKTLQEALHRSGVEEVDGLWEAASALSADSETSYITTYTQHNSATKGYIQKLLNLLQELESQFAKFCGKKEESTTTVAEKRQMK